MAASAFTTISPETYHDIKYIFVLNANQVNHFFWQLASRVLPPGKGYHR